MRESLLEEVMLEFIRIYRGSSVGDQVRGRDWGQGSIKYYMFVCVATPKRRENIPKTREQRLAEEQ